MDRTKIIKQIIRAYRNNAYIYINPRLTKDSLTAKKSIRLFGPINITEKANGETIYGYHNETERIRVIQFVTKSLNNPKKDVKKYQKKTMSNVRQKEIERAMITTFRAKGQFIVIFPAVQDFKTANEQLRPFKQLGDIQTKTNDDGSDELSIDNFKHQIKVIATVTY